MLEKVKALLNTAVTYMVLASGILTSLSHQIADAFPGNHNAELVVQLIISVVAAITTAVLIVRRVVTVIPEQRQLEPLPPGTEIVPVEGTTK